MKFVKLWYLLRYSERTTSKTPTRQKVGVLDVVLSEYVNKSHNFTNFIFMTPSLRNSIPSAFAKIGAWNGLFAIKRKTVFLPWSTRTCLVRQLNFIFNSDVLILLFPSDRMGKLFRENPIQVAFPEAVNLFSARAKFVREGSQKSTVRYWVCKCVD